MTDANANDRQATAATPNPLAALAQIVLLQSRERLPMPQRVSAGVSTYDDKPTAHIDLDSLAALAAWRAALLNLAGDCHDFTHTRKGLTTHCHRFRDLFGTDTFINARVPEAQPGPQLDPVLVDELAAVVSGSDGAA